MGSTIIVLQKSSFFSFSSVVDALLLCAVSSPVAGPIIEPAVRVLPTGTLYHCTHIGTGIYLEFSSLQWFVDTNHMELGRRQRQTLPGTHERAVPARKIIVQFLY